MGGQFDLRSAAAGYERGCSETSLRDNGKGKSLRGAAETNIHEEGSGYKGEALPKIQSALADLKVKEEQAKQKLQELGSSTGPAWEQIKAGVNKAVSDLQNAYNKASSYFKQK
jgi:hypothetical protein